MKYFWKYFLGYICIRGPNRLLMNFATYDRFKLFLIKYLIKQFRNLRDFRGWAWYDRLFYPPSSWNNNSSNIVKICFGSVTHSAIVYLNGQKVVEHEGGYLPFETGNILSILRNLINTIEQFRVHQPVA